jgi:hypothetical protein
MSGSGGFGFVLDLRTIAIAAAIVIAIGAIAWAVLWR